MSDISGFQEQGKTVAVLPTASSQRVQIVERGTGGANIVTAVRIYNGSNALCRIAFGDDQVTATIPTTSTPAYGETIPPGAIEIQKIPRGSWIAVISTGTPVGNIEFTPGEGL
jgi:hypothetical protein